jgi:7-cyano-7-deazaguanine synthase
MVKKAVCLISGGVDSCVASFIAKKEGYEIYAITFNYGQIHRKEIRCSKEIAKAVEAKDHLIMDVDFPKLAGSSLLNESREIEDRNLEDIGKEIPSTYVPARNTVFLSLALAYAETIDADAIFLGANVLDYSGYPDCRPEYLQAFQKMADLATKKGIEGKPIKIETPLLYMRKSEIIKKGRELKAPFEKTWSCYRGEKMACGRCDACLLRLKGFKDAEAEDPLPYRHYPEWYRG